MPGTPPQITSGDTFTINENITAVTTVVATDVDGDPLTFSLTGGADKSRFKINASTGVLEFINAPDYENPTDTGADNTYEVIVTVSDGNLTSTQTITVNVANIGVTLDGTSGNDTLGPVGTTSDTDTLNGLGGNDILDGGEGADIMIGGDGHDEYYVDNVGDQVIETNADSVTGGDDYVYTSVTYTIGDNIEHLHMVGTANINGTGNDGANHLWGNEGNNVLDGKGGADRLDGGDGNDTYYVDDAGDTILEFEDEGIDIVYASVSHTLSSYVENLTFTGNTAVLGIGNTGDNVIRGTAGDDELRGMNGNDKIYGGAGVDTMKGGNGDDDFWADVSLDYIQEAADAGYDTVHAFQSFVLGANIEKLVLEGTAAIDGTGNELANFLLGNDAGNVLTGGLGHDKINGGGGPDTMIGGEGNDKYWVAGTGDVVEELADEGNDFVVSSISYTLTDNVERLSLTGLNKINGTGNSLDNKITGNIVANVLTGLGGDDTLNGRNGADTMVGGEGNDTYYVQDLGDQIIEGNGLLDGDADTIILKKSGYVMEGNADNVENMTFAGTSWINGYGNALDNTITGNNGNNRIGGGDGDDTLYGKGGSDQIVGNAGADVMYGESGKDQFIFNDITDSGVDIGVDTDMIMDYANGEKVDLRNIDAYTSSGTGNESFVVDTDGIFLEGEIAIEQTDNIVTVSLYNDNVAGADMIFQITVGSNVTDVTFLL